MSTFKVVGISKLNGKYKVRFANDMLRVKVLEKNGHTDVDLIELMTPMTKEDAVRKLIDMDFAKGNADIQAALDEALNRRSETTAQPRADKPAKAAKTKPTMDTIKAKVAAKKPAASMPTDVEDAPF